MQVLGVVAIGLVVGFLGGLFGKGGSAIATPLLAAIGVPPLVAVASPLPATVPGTLVAYRSYRGLGISDPSVIRTSLTWAVPATVVGALVTRWIDGTALVTITEVVVALIGVRLLIRPADVREVVPAQVTHRRTRTIAVAIAVGMLAGLLANAGGFLLVPLYLAVLRLPIKSALACSLAVASVLAMPGTVVHAALGHIDWSVTAWFGVASIPLSWAGARVAQRMNPAVLERVYGAGLTVVGVALLALR
jgi:uncharacterized membrane protein YfcA